VNGRYSGKGNRNQIKADPFKKQAIALFESDRLLQLLMLLRLSETLSSLSAKFMQNT